MVGTIFFVRHGETEWNLEGKLQGQADSPLTEKGRFQAKQLANILQPFEIQQLYVSPLGRALHTAQLIKQTIGCQLQENSDLKEISFGSCTGMRGEDIKKQYPDLWQIRKQNKWTFRWPEGESLNDVYGRAGKFISDILSPILDGKIAIVAHESTNKALIGQLLGLSIQDILQIRQPNYVIYQWQRNQRIKFVNSTETSSGWQDGLVFST